ncbi:hypothetical protein [Nocardia miyunensis]|nr:hypothetical protein [Nocardia miyunensis]
MGRKGWRGGKDRHVVAEDSHHYVLHCEPHLVADEVRQLVESAAGR